MTVFNSGQHLIQTDIQKVLVELFLKDEVNVEALSYDRFIFKHILFHSSSKRRLRKGMNCVIKTVDGKFISITVFLRIKTLRGTYVQIVLGYEFQQLNEVLCNHKNFSEI